MLKYSWILVVLFIVMCPDVSAGQDCAERDADVTKLTDYVKQHGLSPQEYIVTRFADHDIVFIGESHRIKHDPVFIQSLIPLLYANGIRHLGFEFAVYEDQELIDKLLTADSFDEPLANRILWNCNPFWGYQEYRDVLRAAWQVNVGRKKHQDLFRIFGLSPRCDWSFVKTAEDRRNPEIMKKVWPPDGNPEAVYATAVLRELVEKRQKGVVYAGINHCYTRYRQPAVHNGEFVRFGNDRMVS